MIPTDTRPQSMDDDSSIEDALATVNDIGGKLAEEYQHHVIKSSTRKAYESKLRRLRVWMTANNYDDGIINGEIVYPLNPSVVSSFLGWVTYSNPIERTNVRSPSTLQGYISALRYGYKKAGVNFPESLTGTVQNISKGFNRNHAMEKQNGNVKLSEGKRALPGFSGFCTNK